MGKQSRKPPRSQGASSSAPKIPSLEEIDLKVRAFRLDATSASPSVSRVNGPGYNPITPDMYPELQALHDDACMKNWMLLSSTLRSHQIGTEQLVSVYRDPSMEHDEHHVSFMETFNTCKEQARNVLMTQGGGKLVHTFPGKSEPEEVEYLGVPSYDTIYYISQASGQVAMSGTGAKALSAKIGHLPMTMADASSAPDTHPQVQPPVLQPPIQVYSPLVYPPPPPHPTLSLRAVRDV